MKVEKSEDRWTARQILVNDLASIYGWHQDPDDPTPPGPWDPTDDDDDRIFWLAFERLRLILAHGRDIDAVAPSSRMKVAFGVALGQIVAERLIALSDAGAGSRAISTAAAAIVDDICPPPPRKPKRFRDFDGRSFTLDTTATLLAAHQIDIAARRSRAAGAVLKTVAADLAKAVDRA